MEYENIDDMITDMYLACEELRNREQKYQIDTVEYPKFGEHLIGFMIWWKVLNSPSGLAIEEIVKQYFISIPVMKLAEAPLFVQSLKGREAFVYALENNTYPIDQQKLEARRIINKGW